MALTASDVAAQRTVGWTALLCGVPVECTITYRVVEWGCDGGWDEPPSGPIVEIDSIVTDLAGVDVTCMLDSPAHYYNMVVQDVPDYTRARSPNAPHTLHDIMFGQHWLSWESKDRPCVTRYFPRCKKLKFCYPSQFDEAEVFVCEHVDGLQDDPADYDGTW